MILDLNILDIGWELGDLSNKSPDEIKLLVSKAYPNTSKLSLEKYPIQFFKFVHEFPVGDYVISDNHFAHKYLIGKISSDYYYSDILTNK